MIPGIDEVLSRIQIENRTEWPNLDPRDTVVFQVKVLRRGPSKK